MNKKMMKRALTLAAFGLLMAGGMMNASAMDRAPVAASKAPAETIDASKLSNAWDKTFPEDARVSHKKVTFHNRYGITLVGDLYTPKDMKPGEKLDAIAVAGPYGAVKTGLRTLCTGTGGPRFPDTRLRSVLHRGIWRTAEKHHIPGH